MSGLLRATGTLAVATTLIAGAVQAQDSHAAHAIPSVSLGQLQRAPTLTEGIGREHDQVRTSSAEAQRLYDVGLNLLHGFEWLDAARAFHQALRADSSLAIAEVGLTYALEELGRADAAQQALARARAGAAAANPHERAHIQARAAQMFAEAAPRDLARLVAYRASLDAAIAAFPRDAEFRILRGIAESADPSDRGQGSPASAVPFYERAIALGGAAAHHYLTHALENGGRPAQALEHADLYAAAAARIPHAAHMRGHVLLRLGRVADAVDAFEKAKAIGQENAISGGWRQGEDWHVEHNLGLLGDAYRYLGRMRRAEEELKGAFELPSGSAAQMYDKREWPDFLIRQGRFQEALVAAARLEAHPALLVQAVGHIEAGLALLGAGNTAAAADRSNRALRALRAAPDGQAMVTPALSQLQGELFIKTGQRERGRAMLRDLVVAQRLRPGPDNWIRTVFLIESIARDAQAAGDWESVEWLAYALVEHDVTYAGGHFMLGAALEHQGKAGSARAQFALARSGWRSADLDLPELDYMRRHLGP